MLLPNRIMHFLWNLLPKRMEMIKGVEIPYVTLPSWLVHRGGMVLHHRKANGLKGIMIFVSSRDPFKRLTICHEWVEGMLYKGWLFDNIFQEIMVRKKVLYELGIPESIDSKIKKWAEIDPQHSLALLIEIELAKEELSPKELSLFLENRKKNQDFREFEKV